MGYLVLLFLRRITNTWAMMSQSFSVVRSYQPLMLLPVISAVFCLLTSIIVVGGSVLVFNIPIQSAGFRPTTPRVSAEGAQRALLAGLYRVLDYDDDVRTRAARAQTPEERRNREHEWLTLFFFYLANYFAISYFNVAFASVVLNHLDGGHATLNDGLQVAWTRKGSILQWAIMASTVGVLVKMIGRRSQLGRWIAGILGYTWRLGSYFAIPILALGDVGAGEALERSTSVLKQKWGEVVVAQFSFSLLFTVLAIPGSALFFLLGGALGQSLGFVGLVTMIYWIWLSILIFSAEQVFIAALYRYATRSEVSKGFTKSDLQSAWEGLGPLPAGQAP
jgi:Family of unknown function (DUF6159)